MSMSDPAPGTSPADLHSLILVLSSAGSGSKLLCRDINSLGGLGMPKEYLRGFRKRPRGAGPAEADVLKRVAMGVQDDAPGVASVNLMVPQAPGTYEALYGKRVPSVDAVPGVISWAKERFEKLFVVFLVRNALDQAISHAVAESTGSGPSSDKAVGAPGGEARNLEIPNIHRLIRANLGRVVRERSILLESYSMFADIGMLLTYDELYLEPAESATRLVTHARKAGFEVKHDVVERKREQVSGAGWSTEIREGFLDYLKNETGREPREGV
ncbi:hypothetical protein [Nocardioides bizhenqiangii]|uniref:Sulphotransferase Stf0 domain-containing protein n=1 Tax=Nocardioides bizhenqiangii TaxID=3095076 RepID=A0ABZ0ZQM6_9ACTN|nr:MULTISPECIES: hypothetical protein [unclassified Nocardioides]MDZ5621235.1 hypothetical protein [Nocardioides sp. HM23]WQQ25922.1 hypothetical protein SHK19_18385 [Nocardioides sp. HM61]